MPRKKIHTIKGRFDKSDLTRGQVVELVEKQGISRRTFYRDLNSEASTLSYQSLTLYANILGITIDELLSPLPSRSISRTKQSNPV